MGSSFIANFMAMSGLPRPPILRVNPHIRPGLVVSLKGGGNLSGTRDALIFHDWGEAFLGMLRGLSTGSAPANGPP